MSVIFDRAFDVAWATFGRAHLDGLAHPFDFDQHGPREWRVSRDVWEDLRAAAGSLKPIDPSPDCRLLGEAIRIDETLPPDSMLLEAIDTRTSDQIDDDLDAMQASNFV